MDHKEEVIQLLKNYKSEDVIFPKSGIDKQLDLRRITKEDIKSNLTDPKRLIFAEKQEREFQGKKDVRYNCYFLFSKSKAHRYVLAFEGKLKVITAIPLGRKTLNKMDLNKILGGIK